MAKLSKMLIIEESGPVGYDGLNRIVGSHRQDAVWLCRPTQECLGREYVVNS